MLNSKEIKETIALEKVKSKLIKDKMDMIDAKMQKLLELVWVLIY